MLFSVEAGEELIDIATERLAQINAAYEEIARERVL